MLFTAERPERFQFPLLPYDVRTLSPVQPWGVVCNYDNLGDGMAMGGRRGVYGVGRDE